MSHDKIALVIATVFILWVFYSFLQGLFKPKSYQFKDIDRFDIGYISDNSRPMDINVHVKTQPKQEPKPKPDTNLVNECVSALKTLGYKSRDAKIEVIKFLDKNKSISSVEDFLPAFFRKT